ncbi:hypothetical protein F4861DRAFT_451530 [Xylaria intraflava]|nr:hypothetical protein F4861DRAFT_451530 [Xylaria intraflava]
MANPRDLDLPIALRRTPRLRSNAAAAAAATVPKMVETPRKPRAKKRVRFSDPGSELSNDDAVGPGSTGLTPMIKRSSLGEPATKRRRIPAAATTTTRKRALSTTLLNEGSMDDIDILSLPSSPDDRVQRRVRREKIRQNGEGVITRKTTARSRTRKENEAKTAEVEAEIQRLRAELADRDAEIARLHDETLIHDTERIVELEQQIKTLRAELARQQLPAVGADREDDHLSDYDADVNFPSRSFYDWTLAARDPFSDAYLHDDEAEDPQNSVMADIACSTPSRRHRKHTTTTPVRSASASFPTPPSTSPLQPATPSSARRVITPATPQSHIGIQASIPDPEKEVLEAELASLRHELGKLTKTLETHSAQQTRVSEKLANALPPGPGSNNPPAQSPDIEANLDQLLRLLAERTTALKDVTESLETQGFEGETAAEILATMTSSFRAARLELESLGPTDTPQHPLSHRGADVLDALLVRLRELTRKVRADADVIEEYRAREPPLRERIAELEASIGRLRSDAEEYKREAAELDKGRAAQVEALQGKVSGARALAAELGAKLREVQRRRDAESKVRNRSAGAALALRDARVLELRREIAGVREGLRAAQETIVGLRVENAAALRRVEVVDRERADALEVVGRLRGEIQGLRDGRRDRACTPEPRPGGFFSGGLARSGGAGRGKGRDSGLGFLEEEGNDGVPGLS